MEADRVLSWELIKVHFEAPATAPFSGEGAVSLALLDFGVIAQVLSHQGPSLVRIPDQSTGNV